MYTYVQYITRNRCLPKIDTPKIDPFSDFRRYWKCVNLWEMTVYGTQVLKLGKRKRAHPQSIFPTPLRNGRLEGVQILNQIRAHLNNERNWKEIIRNQPHPIILSFWSIPDGRFQTHMIHIWVTRHIRPWWPGKTQLRIYVRFYRRSVNHSRIFSND